MNGGRSTTGKPPPSEIAGQVIQVDEPYARQEGIGWAVLAPLLIPAALARGIGLLIAAVTRARGPGDDVSGTAGRRATGRAGGPRSHGQRGAGTRGHDRRAGTPAAAPGRAASGVPDRQLHQPAGPRPAPTDPVDPHRRAAVPAGRHRRARRRPAGGRLSGRQPRTVTRADGDRRAADGDLRRSTSLAVFARPGSLEPCWLPAGGRQHRHLRNQNAHPGVSYGGADATMKGNGVTSQRTHDELGSPLSGNEFEAITSAIVSNIERVIEGKTATVRLALAVMLAEGHLLIEDVPGVGKTKLAKALARSIDCTVRRIQFTPDLLPSDVTGVSVYNQESRDFEFKPGAVFANLVVGDEINRASPKTQSAMLECMEERQVTVDGVTYPLQTPFMVIATQNPIEMEGTYPLPEAQRDRFTARISMGYPDAAAEMTMLVDHAGRDPLETLE